MIPGDAQVDRQKWHAEQVRLYADAASDGQSEQSHFKVYADTLKTILAAA